MPNILHMIVGLPRSGKSFWAQKQGLPIVNPDSIRLALHGKPFISEAEPMVWVITKIMVKALFLAGHNQVILDATNTTQGRRKGWQSKDWVRCYKVFKTPTDLCLQRAADTQQDYLIPIIEKMEAEWEPIGPDDLDGDSTVQEVPWS